MLAIFVFAGLAALLVFNSQMRKRDGAEQWGIREKEMSALEVRLTKVAEQLKSIPSEGRCDETSDCRVVGLGTKTCEGYRDFLVYSVKDTDESRLLAKVREFNEINKKLSDMEMSVPKCGGEPKKPECINQHCVVRE